MEKPTSGGSCVLASGLSTARVSRAGAGSGFRLNRPPRAHPAHPHLLSRPGGQVEGHFPRTPPSPLPPGSQPSAPQELARNAGRGGCSGTPGRHGQAGGEPWGHRSDQPQLHRDTRAPPAQDHGAAHCPSTSPFWVRGHGVRKAKAPALGTERATRLS